VSEFKEGDVVFLKSGGPAMTITELSDDRESFCEWFDKHHAFHSKSFINTALIKDNPNLSKKSAAV